MLSRQMYSGEQRHFEKQIKWVENTDTMNIILIQ